MLKLTGWEKLVHRLVVLIICLMTLVPLYWLLVLSVTPQRFVSGMSDPAMFPVEPTFESYQQLLFPDRAILDRSSPVLLFRLALLNSTIISVTATILGVIFGGLAAYALARLRFGLNRFTFVVILGSHLIAPITLAIPLFSIFREMGWLDTYAPLIVVYAALTMSWSTLIMFNYFRMLPVELEDAARMEGCSRVGTLFRIVLPTALPGIISVATVTFLFSWGEFLFALLFTSSAASRTLPIVATMFVGEMGVEYRMIATVIVLTIIPPVLFALFFQRYIVSGLTAGSVKG